jgi:hypothetical protein
MYTRRRMRCWKREGYMRRIEDRKGQNERGGEKAEKKRKKERWSKEKGRMKRILLKGKRGRKEGNAKCKSRLVLTIALFFTLHFPSLLSNALPLPHFKENKVRIHNRPDSSSTSVR